ncbi:hypothetical protein F5Y08DRAFT_307565 [Xylaria arbuscula]|nr:hypothetical protein F5Y08DRAFT_307565 [Xylaria arbuscula]
MRSRTGCQSCRARKLKCDEARPVCAQCVKSTRDCTYVEPSVFRNFDIRSTRRSDRERSAALSENCQDSRTENSPTWVAIPPDLQFIQVNDPYALDDWEVPAGTDSVRDFVEEQVITENVPACQSPSKLSSSLEALSPSITREQFMPLDHTRLDYNVVAVRLVRHFKHGPGQWMDLFDTTAYFSSKVPVIAGTKPLLKDAICALAAKHLRNYCKICNSARYSSTVPGRSSAGVSNDPDWRYYSMRYYDQALGHLKESVTSGRFHDDRLEKEEIFAAVAILCTYELMDAPSTAWRAHLSALPLFSQGASSALKPSEIIIPTVPVKGPAFWSLVRQDLLCAFISETPTQLDPKDIRLWQNAGLRTNGFGTLLFCDPECSITSQARTDVEEDTKSNELTWLLGKIANHLTAGDSLNLGHDIMPFSQQLPVGLSQKYLLYRWKALMDELDHWFCSLPPTFAPSARTRQPFFPGDPGECLSVSPLEQVWYDLPLCAAAMQSYHQAKILLLVNEPHESTALRSTVCSRLTSYRHALAEAEWHAREVCGISLADPTDAVRINSVQALFVAGQVLEAGEEQNTILNLLADIETELGWTTKYHIAKLTEDWAKRHSDNHVDR